MTASSSHPKGDNENVEITQQKNTTTDQTNTNAKQKTKYPDNKMKTIMKTDNKEEIEDKTTIKKNRQQHNNTTENPRNTTTNGISQQFNEDNEKFS